MWASYDTDAKGDKVTRMSFEWSQQDFPCELVRHILLLQIHSITALPTTMRDQHLQPWTSTISISCMQDRSMVDKSQRQKQAQLCTTRS